MKDLASTYYHNKILNSTTNLDAFVRDFNIRHSISDFVNVNDEKECANFKLKDKLTFYDSCNSIKEERRYLTLILA